MVAFGLVSSWWAVLAVPAALLIAFAFAGAGLGLTTFMRSWVDFDYVNLALVPMFLFSATFFPLSRYPEALQVVVKVTPLYQGVALLRGSRSARSPGPCSSTCCTSRSWVSSACASRDEAPALSEQGSLPNL